MTGTAALPAVSVRGLVKKYPLVRGYRELLAHPFRRRFVTALDGVDLEVGAGRCHCLLGPNGAGKTTLIKILATLVLPDGGRACVGGFDVERDPGRVKETIGLAVGDERSFYWRLTGRQNLMFFAALSDIPAAQARRRVDKILALVGLEDVADLRFNTYCTGKRQMLAFARALLTNARMLFVDEPTRSLDPGSARKIRAFIRKELVEGQGCAVLWATHNLAEAAEVADDLAIIDKGRIRVSGRTVDVTCGGSIALQKIYDDAVETGEPDGPGLNERGSL
ncbi:MAG TPA: ABC transporter ATP-binding protein [Acidobacteriota bacterium]|nr:ABC transporter ATP-binding protein [Acidobacteriota bacterium]